MQNKPIIGVMPLWDEQKKSVWIHSGYIDGIIMAGDEKFDSSAGKLFSVESADILDGGIMYNTEGGYADEISVIKFADGVDGQQIMKDRLESRTSTFRDYRPEELDKL